MPYWQTQLTTSDDGVLGGGNHDQSASLDYPLADRLEQTVDRNPNAIEAVDNATLPCR
jgi:hypothetical protein